MNNQNTLNVIICSFIAYIYFIPIIAQPLHLNEISPSNSTFLDEDKEAKDWIELYNSSDAAISLENWSITDDLSDPQKWQFPAVDVSPKAFYTLFASGKDRNQRLTYRTVLREGDDCKYKIPNVSTSKDWRNLDFEDNLWLAGKTGIGYGDEDDQTIVPNRTRSVYLRQKFVVADPTNIARAILHVDYDDGFVAYLNGQEIARANIDAGEFPPYYASVFNDREAEMYEGGFPEKFIIEEVADLLVAGENVLAIQVHNINTNSSDLTIIPFLSLGEIVATAASNVPEILDLGTSFLHTNFKIGATETIYLFNSLSELVDSLHIPQVPGNVTVGRFPDGANNQLFFEESSPNASNPDTYFLGISDEVVSFSQAGGIYPEEVTLSLTSASAGVIRYTTNGADPTTSSTIFSNPIKISHNTTVKAAVFQQDYLPSTISAHSYLIGITHDLPILNIAFDRKDFFSETTGMYSFGSDYEQDFPHFGANFWKDLEKPVHLSYFENGQSQFATGAGAKVFGGWSRGNPQRSLSIFFRKAYGNSALKYPFFPERPYDNYEAFILRNSGNDWQRTMLRDLTLTGLLANSNVDIQAGKPVVTYFNGEYWGIYNAREKINEHYLSALHNVSAEEITILEKDGEVIFGNNQAYTSLINFVQSNDLSIENNYQQVTDEIDLANYIQYQVAQIYFDNTDWPGNNVKFWKAKNGKWRWILFDTDFGFGIWDRFRYSNNTLDFALKPNGAAWPNPPWSTLLFRKLIENEQFKHRFINTFADELNTRFLAVNVRTKIEENRQKIRNEMPQHIERWGNLSMSSWQSKVNEMNTFASQRANFMRTHLRNQFNLPSQRKVELTIEQPNAGSIQLNSIRITDEQWSGFYFQTVPITLTAIAKSGYTFSHWTGDINSTQRTIKIDPNKTIQLQAHFVETGIQQPASEVLFNEINYNSNDSIKVGDWVELYNNGGEQDLTDWIFKDDDDSHIFKFPIGTILAADEYLVLTSNQEKFAQRFPNVANTIGDFDFGLSSKGEFIRLYDAEGALVDSLFYLPDNGWPEAANGDGPTLELISPDRDNTVPENWVTFTSNGTPGRQNGIYTSIFEVEQLSNKISIAPNPFNDQFQISINLPKTSNVQIDLLNINGQWLQKLLPQQRVQQAQFNVTISDLVAGTYFIKVAIDDKQIVKKIVKR